MKSRTLLPGSERAFADAGIGTWRWDAATGHFDLSPEAIAMLQVRRDNFPLTLESSIESMHREDVAGFIETLKSIRSLSDGPRQTSFRIRLDSGELGWFRAIGRPINEGRLRHAAGVVIDVTAERQAAQYHSLFFEQPNGLRLIAGLDGRIKRANRGWELALGYTVDEFVGRDIFSLIHENDIEATRVEMQQLARGLSTNYFENRYRHRDGSYRLLVWSAVIPEEGRDIYAVARDITDERAAQYRLAQVAAVFDNSGEGIIVTDLEGVIRDVNAAFTQITGYSASDAIGARTNLLSSGRHDKTFYERMWATLEGKGFWRGEIWNRRKNGDVFPELLTVTRFGDAQEGGYIGIFTDISHLKDSERQLQQLAHYDQLTRLPNRYLINERLTQSLRRARRRKQRLAVIFLDVDSFKSINDSFGHDAGDRLLTTTAQRLRDVLREDDAIGRIGGDEFLIVLEDVTSAEDIAPIAEKIIDALRLPMTFDRNEISVSASLGISLYPEDGKSAEVLMRNADAAMYSAKEQGRDTFRFYSDGMTREAFQQVLLDSALREAIPRQELRLAYQPQINLETGRIIGLEVLLRWHHPQLGTVPPGEFIPNAERTGAIRRIGQWVLEHTCRQGMRWLKAGYRFERLAVNVSVSQFRNPDFLPALNKVLETTGLPGEYLELEITESLPLHDAEEMIDKMKKIHRLGIRFSIDDFGTGYSSLGYLKRMPIDRLKLDRSFVQGIDREGNNRIIAGAVIALAQALGVEVIAEGVEERVQEQALIELGCTRVQGYLYSTPQYAEQIETALRRASEA